MTSFLNCLPLKWFITLSSLSFFSILHYNRFFGKLCNRTNIPIEAYNYQVNGKSAIGWIIDQYQINTDNKTGIVNDPNEFSDDPKYILNLLLSIITVSMRTLELIDELPEFEVIE